MTNNEKNAWISLKKVIKVSNLLKSFRVLGCKINTKVHYLHSHLDWFPKKLKNVSEEQGERFYQDIKEMEGHYQGKWFTALLADYWSLQRDELYAKHKRRSNTRSLENKKNRYRKIED